MQQVAHEALGTVGISVPGIDRGRDDSGTDPSNATVTTPAAGANFSGATPTTSPAGAVTSPVPTTARVGGAEPATGIEHSDGEGIGPTNPNAGEGNNNAGGVGNRNDNGDPQGTPAAGDGTDTPVNNLPPPSNGKGNGPTEVPPGRPISQRGLRLSRRPTPATTRTRSRGRARGHASEHDPVADAPR